MAELHLNNQRLRREASPWQALEAIRSEMSFLTRALSQPEREAKAIYGKTMHHIGAQRLGFQVRRLLPGLYSWLVYFFFTGLLAGYHPMGRRRLAQGRHPLKVAEIWMSRGELERRYS